MSQLKQLQQLFLSHLLGEPSKVIEHIQSTADATAQQRLGIYASGYRLRLKEAITTDHDCMHGYLGDDAFDQLLESYINTYHSNHPSLRYYSKQMIEFLSQHLPYSNHPELLEIAQIEQAFNNSFDAENCSIVEVEQLGQFATESWPNLRLQIHASVQLLPCKHNSFAIWKALSEEQTPPELEKDSTTWLVWRKNLVSRYRALSDAEAHVLALAIQGENFSKLCEGLLSYYDEEKTPAQAITYLQTWINDMMVCDLS